MCGDRQGALTSEESPTDSTNRVNEVLVQAERVIQSLRSDLVKVCVLRLGGIYGPGRDTPGLLLSAPGNLVQRNGLNIPSWVHLDDVVREVSFAF